MMLAYRLVRLIETHSDQLANGLFQKLKNSEKLAGFTRVPPDEFKMRTSEVYRHLGEWLLGKTEHDIARWYREIGERRSQQGVPLAELIWALALTKENLMEFLRGEVAEEQLAEILGELEILQLLEQFFDRAMYYAALGYEHSRRAHAAAAHS